MLKNILFFVSHHMKCDGKGQGALSEAEKTSLAGERGRALRSLRFGNLYRRRSDHEKNSEQRNFIIRNRNCVIIGNSIKSVYIGYILHHEYICFAYHSADYDEY